jgi:hypothetical protein
LSATVLPTGGHDRGLHLGGGPSRAGSRPRGPVEQSNGTLATEWAYRQVFTSNDERAAVP